ncbi:MAG TPA: S53 family peptidase [Fimbriimonadaceae bacterium]|nr:S53 family peptidase [Fimbriimonadaceae bacterium]
MKILIKSGLLVAASTALIALSGCGGTTPKSFASASLAPSGQGEARIIVPESSRPQPPGFAHTNHIISYRGPAPVPSTPKGLTVAQVRSAYNVGVFSGTGAIAIVDAYHYPTALNDFNVFSTTFGLPTETSTNATASSNQHFQVVYASGKKPRTDGGWALEAALDIEWAHAMAPNAKIYLVEAASNSFSDLIAAENVAKSLAGVREVSNSWGGSESSSVYSTYDSVFVQSGVSFFASGGDSGGVKSWPALSKNVVGIGGTTLNMQGNIRLSETTWGSTGCGISAYEPRPAFQDAVSSIVGTHRGIDDVSAVADPNTGASVYDTTKYLGITGWWVVGGTSLSCPLIAGMANAAGGSRSSSNAQNTAIYAGLGGPNFNDITVGSAGSFPAMLGYDLPTGVGTPNGLGGF